MKEALMQDKNLNERMTQIVSKSKLLYIESSTFDANWHSTLHSHPFTELFYVIQGQGQFQFYDGSTIEVRQDDLLIINPNIVHTEISDVDNPLQYIVLGIEGIGFITSHNVAVEYSIHNYEEYKHEILFYLRSIYKEDSNDDIYKYILLNHLLNVLIINIVRRSQVVLSVQEDEDKTNKDCLFIENYLNTHFRENITLDKLAELTFINKFYLSHIFKQHSGYSPIEYVLHKRLEAATKLIITTDLGISQISGIVGFGNSSYFSQYFKREMNMSPTEYRLKHKESPTPPQ